LNGKGEVIGVSVATFRGGQNLNFAIPSNYLKALLRKTGPAKPLGQAKPANAQRSILSDLGGRSVEGVVGGTFAWANQYYERDGKYTITLRNQLREPVRNIYCLVVFFDRNGNPLDVDMLHHRDVIPPGLGKRASGDVDPSVKRLTTPGSERYNGVLSSFEPDTKVEFHVLDFEIVQ